MATTTDQVTPTIDSETVAERRLASAGRQSSLPPRTERRLPHQFQGPEGAGDGYSGPLTCVRCGYADTGHVALTNPERVVIIGLLAELRARPFMRRDISRKLDLN